MNKTTLAGLIIIILGIAMFLFGASMFSYSGPALSPLVSSLGEYSFMFWLPTIIIGLVFFTWSKRRKRV